MGAKVVQKMHICKKISVFIKKFAYMQKKQYLCALIANIV